MNMLFVNEPSKISGTHIMVVIIGSLFMSLLKHLLRHRHIWLLTLLGVLVLTRGQAAMAQCIYNGVDTYTCSGDITGATIVGTTGNDVFVFLDGTFGTGVQIASGGQALRDRINFSASTTAITLDLASPAALAGPQTVYAGLQIWFQGFVNTHIDGSQANDVITGSSGHDIINGGAGDDLLNGDAGVDNIDGQDGNDILNGGQDTDGLYDTGTGNDILNGQDGNDYVWGGAGDDTLDGGPGLDGFRDASNGDITVDLPGGTVTGNGTDTITGVENITLGDGDDVVIGDASDSVISVGNGNNSVDAGAGADAIYGGNGVDIIDGGAGDDSVEAYEGDDVIIGGPGRDDLRGGDDTDTRADTNVSDCVDDIMTNIEIDTCASSPIEIPVNPSASELCITTGTRVSVERSKLLIFSDFGAHNPNGMMITEISLSSILAPTDEQKTADAWVPLAYKDSEFAPGWSVGLYWHDSHYGVQIFKSGALFDDTGAICGWF
jgi:hypothetical protein